MLINIQLIKIPILTRIKLINNPKDKDGGIIVIFHHMKYTHCYIDLCSTKGAQVGTLCRQNGRKSLCIVPVCLIK